MCTPDPDSRRNARCGCSALPERLAQALPRPPHAPMALLSTRPYLGSNNALYNFLHTPWIDPSINESTRSCSAAPPSPPGAQRRHDADICTVDSVCVFA